MITSIAIHRSDAWVEKQRLQRGENVPETIDVDVSPFCLSEAARAILLQIGNGKYDESYHFLPYGERYTPLPPGGFSRRGRINFVVDSDDPSAAQIDSAILDAGKQLDDRRAKHESESAEREQRKADEEQRRAKSRIDQLQAERNALIEHRDNLARKLRKLAKSLR